MGHDTSPTTVRCPACGTEGARYEFRHGEFCSTACEYRHRGQAIVDTLEADHRICSSCYARIKTTSPAKPLHVPGPDHAGREDSGPKQISDGFQFKTPNTTIAVDDFADGGDRWRRLEGTRWSCRCGAVDPNGSPITELQNIHLEAAIANFYRALRWLAETGEIPAAPNRERYFAALRERPRDAAYAAGTAVYGGD